MAPPLPLLLLLATSSSCFHQLPSIYPAPLTLRAFNAFLQPPLNPFSLLHPPKKISTSRPLKKIPPPKISSRISASLASRPIALLRDGLNSASRLANYFIQDEERNQCKLQPYQRFPCTNTAPSKSIPNSVHRLRPGDIKVVAGLGDSITAGLGARANSVLDIFTEYRGVSFSIGGLGTWRQFVTLPNILEIFNPSLYGAAESNTRVGEGETSGFNFAVSGSTSLQLPTQAWRLIRAMKRDPHIDFKQDWKMVTIIIGHNDACTHVCNTTIGVDAWQDGSSEGYARNLQTTLDILQKNLPRTFVNLVPMSDVSLLVDLLDKPKLCHLLHWYFCPCLFNRQFTDIMMNGHQMKSVLSAYKEQLTRLLHSGRYDTEKDFTVVIQPSLINGEVPSKFNKLFKRYLPDLSYLAPDCFHFSQKLHALVGRSLWNNLLQPVGSKTNNWKKDVPFLCPSKTSPYIATKLNSAYQRRTRTSSLARDWWSLLTTGQSASTCTL